MSRLLLLVYDGEETADAVLADLRARAADLGNGDLRSCGVVRVAADGRFTVTTTDWPGSGGPFWGMLWEALFGLVFLVPVAGSSYGPNVGGLLGSIDRAGIDERIRARIRKPLHPRTSGLVMLLREPAPGLVAEIRRAYGGTVVEATIALEQDSELAQELGGITV